MNDGVAICSAINIGHSSGAVPDWLHLLPAGTVHTRDGRGPYRIDNPSQLIGSSLTAENGKLVICENHATDIAAPKGRPSPARGWITKMEQRPDGIWGMVEWTDEGRRLVQSREYRGISPVIAHRKDGTVVSIKRATLTNTPNLEGLSSLHSQENNMTFRMSVIRALGISTSASDAMIVVEIELLKKGGGTAIQSTRSPEQEAIFLSQQATIYQKSLADGGVMIDFATAVSEVQKRQL